MRRGLLLICAAIEAACKAGELGEGGRSGYSVEWWAELDWTVELPDLALEAYV